MAGVDQAVEARWLQVIGEVLARSHLFRGDQLAGTVDAAVARLGMRADLYLVDHEQVLLRALTVPDRSPPPPLAIDSSVAGRAFAMVRPMADHDGRLWSPLVDGTERVGVVHFTLPAGTDADDPAWQQRCELLAGLVGHLVNAKMAQSDYLHQVRRSQPMSPAAELLWQLLPPLTSSNDDLVITAIMQPCYDIASDAYDYAMNDCTARVVLLDAMGGDLAAGMACAAALAAIRAARRAGADLTAQARAADTVLSEHVRPTRRSRFVTAILAELDVDSGRLRYLNAGHPAPLLLRDTRLVGPLLGGRRPPLSSTDTAAEVAEVMLEPGDRLLLHTDGVTEARAADGTRFGATRLVDIIERCEAAGLPAPETLRRLNVAVANHRAGPATDDATMLLLEWSGDAARRVVPISSLTTTPPGDNQGSAAPVDAGDG